MDIRLIWQRSCVGGDCDALYTAPGGKIAVLRKVTGEARDALHGPGEGEEAVFIPDDVIKMLRQG